MLVEDGVEGRRMSLVDLLRDETAREAAQDGVSGVAVYPTAEAVGLSKTMW
jgi:hypothetical protein